MCLSFLCGAAVDFQPLYVASCTKWTGECSVISNEAVDLCSLLAQIFFSLKLMRLSDHRRAVPLQCSVVTEAPLCPHLGVSCRSEYSGTALLK